MANNSPYLQDTLIVGVDLYGNDGKDDAILTVSRQIMGSIVLVKTFKGDEAIDIYNRLIDKERLDDVIKQAEIEAEEEHKLIMEKVAAKKENSKLDDMFMPKSEPDPFFRGIMTERAADALIDICLHKDIAKHDSQIRKEDLFPELAAQKFCLDYEDGELRLSVRKEDLEHGN